MRVKIKKRSQAEWLTLFIFVMPFTFYAMDLLQLPDIFKYLIDVAWVVLLAMMLLGHATFPTPYVKGILRVTLALFFMTLIRYVLEYKSILYYLWGLRNNARFFVFFAACVMFLKRDSGEAGLMFMDKLFFINLLMILYQYFVMGKEQDYLGGIFGIRQGCNGYSNIFLVIVSTWHVLRYMNRQENVVTFMVRGISALLVAGLMELKIFFIEFCLVVVLASIMTKFSIRKLWIILISAVGIYIGIEIIKILFPHFGDWFTFERILRTATSRKGYSSTNDFNRLTAVGLSWTKFLKTWPQKFFGLGLGNCDYASGYRFLSSPFYNRYKALNYVWFSTSFMILENGLVGLILYLYFFLKIFLGSWVAEKHGGEAVGCQMARIMAVMSIVFIIYNSSMRIESGYMVYFVLALPFMRNKTEMNSRCNKITLRMR